MGNLGTFIGDADFSDFPEDDFSPVPPGNYPVYIESAEVRQTRAGTGHYIALRLVIDAGEYQGRKIFENINIDNPSQKAVEIGLRKLRNLGESLGLRSVSDTGDLEGGRVIARLKVRDDRNEVARYIPLEGVQTATEQPPQKQQTPKRLPWQKSSEPPF